MHVYLAFRYMHACTLCRYVIAVHQSTNQSGCFLISLSASSLHTVYYLYRQDSVAQGWLDITYLSPDGCFRLSRGNKGTLFVLVRDDPSTDRLLAAISFGASDAQVRPCCLAACVVRSHLRVQQLAQGLE